MARKFKNIFKSWEIIFLALKFKLFQFRINSFFGAKIQIFSNQEKLYFWRENSNYFKEEIQFLAWKFKFFQRRNLIFSTKIQIISNQEKFKFWRENSNICSVLWNVKFKFGNKKTCKKCQVSPKLELDHPGWSWWWSLKWIQVWKNCFLTEFLSGISERKS